MDFSQVKDITIPEGSVKKIEVNGTTIWEKDTTVHVTGISLVSAEPIGINRTVQNKVFFSISPNDATDKSVTATITDGSGYNIVSTGGNYVQLYRVDDATQTAILHIVTNDGGFEITAELYKA